MVSVTVETIGGFRKNKTTSVTCVCVFENNQNHEKYIEHNKIEQHKLYKKKLFKNKLQFSVLINIYSQTYQLTDSLIQ